MTTTGKKNRSLKRHYGQRFPMPHWYQYVFLCLGNGAAAPQGSMTYNSTQGNFWGSDLGSKRLDLGSGRPDLRSKRPDMGSMWPNFGSERLDFRSERSDFGSMGPDFE